MIDVGESVGNYNIIAKLGEGGMGMVYLAEHPVIGRKVAFKAIHPQFARNPDVISRFVNEARSVNQIGHQHIVDITDFGNTAAGNFYFIMEYLQGDTLAGAIRREGRFPVERALRIAAQISDALSASHEHGVIHRDLKPENIFLIARDEDPDFVKVLDFGLAKLTDATAVPTHNTRTGTVMGTPYYMSPEQCEGRVEVDHRGDIYALGVILFEMLTGKLPFGGEGYGEIIVKHVTMQPPAARSIVPELPAALDMILSRALEKAPDNRFQTMAELRQALLHPEEYASSMPALAAAEDLTARIRAAMPMARTEMKLSPYRSYEAGAPLTSPGHDLSTFGTSTGQLVPDPEAAALRPRPRHARTVAVAIVAASLLAFGGYTFRRQAGRLMVAAGMPRHPATVRLNFSSDPDGATVARADGTVLGVTPLSTEVAYSDEALGYVVRMVGYRAKPLAVVPNMAAPLFATLEREPADSVRRAVVAQPAAAPVAADDIPSPSPSPAPSPAPAQGPRPRWRASPAARAISGPDRDDAMEPTAPPAPPAEDAP